MAFRALDFEPIRLRRAREHIVDAHPDTAAVRAAPAESLLDQLRARIAAVANSPVKTEALAFELTPKEIRAIAVAFARWEDLHAPAVTILRLRLHEGLVSPLWHAWQRYPVDRAVLALIRDAARQFGLDSAVARIWRPAVLSWLKADDPADAVRVWLGEEGLSYSDIFDIHGFPLDADTPIGRLVRNAVMTSGSATQLLKEGVEQLTRWMTELDPDERMRFGQNYLTVLSPEHWGHGILTRIESSYGLPRKPRLPRFWEEVPDEAKNAFHAYFIRLKLRRSLSDDDRYEYWLRWSDDLHDVEIKTARDGTPYGILDFGAFGVLEFFAYGNAAYFCGSDSLEQVARGRADTPQTLRHEVRRYRYDRLIHRAPWHGKATRLVRRWMRQSAKA